MEDEYNYMKKVSIDFVITQLILRGENAVPAHRLSRHDIYIKDKDIKIKVKFSKPIRRSRSTDKHWEFIKVVHGNRLWPTDIFHYYILVGFGENGNVEKIWKISVDDKIIYRKNQIFIPVDEDEKYNKYELEIIAEEGSGGIKWID